MVKSKTGKSKSHLIAESAAIDIGRRLNESANSLRRAGRALGDNSADFDHSRKAARLGASGLVPPLSATGTQSLNILLIDDSLELPKVYARTSQRLNGRMRVQSCNPTSVQDAIIAIRKALRASPPVNLLLIDHQLQGELCGEHIFQALNALQHSDDLPLRYLPRAAITESPDETKTLADTMLALGADAVYFEKAQVQPRAASSSDNGEVGQDTPVEQFLRSLLDTEYKEMRARAWGRVWRDTRNRVEEQILSQRENSCISTLQLQELVAKCWYLISRNLVDSGYVKRANFRIFSGSRLESIEPVTPELRRYGLASIDWDDLPYVQRWLIQACADASNGQTGEWIKYCVPKLAQADIIPVSVHIDSRYNAFLELLRGNAVMGMPLITQHGPIGLFVLVREPGSPAFGQTDWDQMRTLGLRLASYVQDLSSQVREFQRRQGLVTLYQELQSAPNESGLLQIALHHVHEMVFSAALGLHGSPQMPPRTGVDDDGRSTVRWLSPDGCYPGWGLGAGVSNPSLIPLNKRHTSDSSWQVQKVIIAGKPAFFQNTVAMPNYVPPMQGLNTSLMQVPVIQGGLCVAVFAMGHRVVAYFGQHQEQSTDFRYLTQVAAIVGRVIEGKRAARFQRGLVQAMLEVGRADTNAVLDHLVNVLHGYTRGCAAMLWVEPSPTTAISAPSATEGALPWRFTHYWLAKPENTEQNPAFEGCLVRQPAESLLNWNHALAADWKRTYIATSVFAAATPLDYTESEFLKDTREGIDTQAQANLRICSGIDAPKALLVMIFLVPAAVNLVQERETFNLFSSFCARYLDDRAEWDAAAVKAQLADDARLLADSYHAMRHGLRSQFWHIGDALNEYLDAYKRLSVPQKTLRVNIERYILSAGQDVDVSAVLEQSPTLTSVNLYNLAQQQVTAFGPRARSLDVTIEALPINKLARGEARHFQIVLNTLVDNALDEFEAAPSRQPRRIVIHFEKRWLHPDGTSSGALCVSDTGLGVAADMRDKLFQRNRSGKAKGTGFALYFAKALMQRIRWDIVHDAAYTEGARFVLVPAGTNENSSIAEIEL